MGDIIKRKKKTFKNIFYKHYSLRRKAIPRCLLV